MNLPEILLILTFGILLVLVSVEKIEKLIGGILGAIIVFFILFFTEAGFGLTTLLEFIDFEIVLTILGILVSVEATRKSGFFQWLGVLGIKATKGRASPLFILLCLASGLLSGFVTSIAVMIVIGGLTVDIARILDISPVPYLTAEAITVNVGVLISPIASIPNIIIYNEFSQASFAFYAINLAPFSLALLPLTIFTLLNRLDILEEPTEERRTVLMEFNQWTVVRNRRLFKECAVLFIGMITSFIIVPNIIPEVELWLLAVVSMFGFLALPDTDADQLVKNIDWTTIFFLIGLFIMVEALSYRGVLKVAARGIKSLVGDNAIFSILIIFWISFLASGIIDNIAVTIAFIPIVSTLINSPELQPISPILLVTLIIGVNLGGNLTPMASPTTVLAMSLSKKSGDELTPKRFFKIGFSTALFQASVATGFLFLVFVLTTNGVSLLVINVCLLIVAFGGYAFLYFQDGMREKLISLFEWSKRVFSSFTRKLKEKIKKN